MKNKNKKLKIFNRFYSVFFSSDTSDVKWWNKWNTYMEYLVELPTGQRVWMSRKEIDKFNEDFKDGK